MNSLTKPAFIYLSLGFLPLFSNFLLAPFFTRYLSPKEYGILALAAVFQKFMMIFIDLGLKNAFSRFYYRYFKRAYLVRSLFISVIAVLFVITLSYFLALWFFGDWLFSLIFKSDGLTFTGLGKYILVLTIASMINALFLTYFRNGEQIGLFALYSLSAFVLMTTGAVVGVIGLRAGAMGSIVGKMSGAALVSGLFLLVFMLRKPSKARISPVFYKRLYAFGLPFFPLALLETASVNMDKFFVERLLSLEILGQYNVAFILGSIPYLLLNSMQSAFNPPIMKKLESLNEENRSEVYGYVNKLFKAQVLLIVLVIMVFVTCAAPAVLIFIGKEYHGITEYVPLLFLCVLPFAFRCQYNTVFVYHYESSVFPKMSLIAFLFGLALNYILIKAFGVVGTVFALFGRNILQNILYRFVMKHKKRFIPELYSFGRVGLVAVFAYASTIGGFALTKYLPPMQAYGLAGLSFFCFSLIILNRQIVSQLRSLAASWH